jgi:hypothetical protein
VASSRLRTSIGSRRRSHPSSEQIEGIEEQQRRPAGGSAPGRTTVGRPGRTRPPPRRSGTSAPAGRQWLAHNSLNDWWMASIFFEALQLCNQMCAKIV